MVLSSLAWQLWGNDYDDVEVVDDNDENVHISIEEDIAEAQEVDT